MDFICKVEHFAGIARKMNVDVELQNHPLYDGFEMKLEGLRTRSAAQPHPFVAGAEADQRFLTVMTECTRVQLERRKL